MSALVSLELISTTCCHAGCGVVSGLNKGHYNALRDSHAQFYCPNGHAQHFTAKSDAEIAKADAAAARERAVRAENIAGQERAAREAAEKKLTSATKRAHAGVCTLGCNRTFPNVAKHMATVHRGEKFVRPKAKR